MSMKRLCIASLLGALVVHSCMFELANCASNYTDQLALLAFKSSINFDPNNVLSNWTKETNFCDWVGILCSRRRQRVTSLRLLNMGLQGTISPHIGNLSFLQVFIIHNNSFHGHLPNEFECLRRLKKLIVQHNMLEGSIPVGLHRCQNLQVISLSANNFSGDIPKELSTLPFLRILFLGRNNNLQGTIPPFFGNTTSLEYFGVEFNNIYGNIPIELSLLPNLSGLYCQANNLTGSIPRAIFNKSSMTEINFNMNAFSGNLPTTTRIWLPNLETLGLECNQLVGEIPLYLSNSSKLTWLFLDGNLFTGPIPKSLGNLKLIEKLDLGDNQLTTEPGSTQLSFITALTNCTSLQQLVVGENKFSGTIPNSIGNFSMSLQVLDVSECQLMGQIPKEIGSLRNLYELLLAGNNLNGNNPSTIGGIERLQSLDLSANNFHGSIPSEICLLRNLFEIYLQANKLFGSIPSCITKLSSLQVMDISSNKLTLIPSSLWNFENLRLLNLSFNSLNGSLEPHNALKALENMDLSWNRMSGNIPRIIGAFERLTSLNLSRNSFSGPIPNSIGNLLSGEIPSKGPFTNLTVLSFIGNEERCGNSILQVRPCPHQSSQRLRTKDVLLRYIVPAIALLVIFSSLLWIVKGHRRKNVRGQHSNDLLATIEHKKISYQELQRATTNFCEANLLGVGSYGSVYKGILSDGTIVAIKILNLQVEGAFRSFDTECEVLRTTRHRNLVRVITTCSSPELRALVLQYMSNGSLDKCLYSHSCCLNLFQRVSIMIDVALALEYLHDGQSEPVVHCDLKPSNVLVDEDMIAHVADFGITKILAENKTATQTNTLGTLGYIAPEYGCEGRVSTSSDIYSYGIMLLETFTRKKPTDEMFTEERSLRQWVSTRLPDEVMEVVDSGLLRTHNKGDMVATQSNLIAILELGLGCSRELVAERIQIQEVLGKLNKIKRQLLQSQSV
ncbi:hypothetical protein TEA_014628 [Camellia sinensis var. sinensis]|uniref:non-specific serine/threonine protein kinase n=1 Tax=Camellia sinensis var. sinensis TaxID=542762 RepID=A0A4S4DWJ4_CAMSN|nr:hypothetical protein TEA_014628 [Camellia sinensis var. sinensis]